jgi:predicted nucleotidyltransferase component of viral defense system
VSAGRVASIHARLLNLARQQGGDFNLLLDRYAVERWLYRLSQSGERDRLWLKGAMLFYLWLDQPHRPTRDADFLGMGNPDANALRDTIQAVCRVAADDGMEFDAGSVRVEEIREEARYGGLRVRLVGRLGRARCTVQLDVGYGDAVTPGVEEVDFPTLLDDVPAPRLKVYPRETMFAEKLEAITSLGMANSRMKDYFDLRALTHEGKLDVEVLGEAIAATFARRATPLPDDLPVGLTEEFATDASKRQQWHAFAGKVDVAPLTLEQVVAEVGGFSAGPLGIARSRAGRQ